jgi:hypothetical protein
MANKTITIDIQANDAPIKTLKEQLKEAKREVDLLAGAPVVDEERLQEAVKNMAVLKDRVGDVNDQVKELATGSEFEKMKNSIGGVGSALSSLNFDKATTSAKQLTDTITNLNPAVMAQQFAAFGGTLLQLGKAVGMLTVKFVQMGIALLTNPIFLLVAAITAIVAGIVLLMHKLGLLQPILDALMAPIKMLIDGFYALTDAIGITNKAGEKNREEMEKQIALYEEQAKKGRKLSDDKEYFAREELKRLKALDDGTKEYALKIINAEQEIIKQKAAALKEELKMAEKQLAFMVARGGVSVEEYNRQKEAIIGIRKELSATATEYTQFAANAKKTMDKFGAKPEDKQKPGTTTSKPSGTPGEDPRVKWERDVARMIEDINIATIQNEEERLIKAEQTKIARQKEDYMRSEAFLNASLKQQEIIIKDFDSRIAKVETDAKERERLKEEEHLNKINNLRLTYQKAGLDANDFQGRMDLRKAEYDEETRLLKEKLDNDASFKEEYNMRIKMAEQSLNNDLNVISEQRRKQEEENAQLIVKAEEDLQNAKISAAMAGVQLLGSIFSGNEKIQKALFLVEKGKAAADVVVNGLKTNAQLVAQISAGTGLLGNPITAAVGAAQIAAAKKGLITNKIGMGVALAGIAAASIDKFKNGGNAPSSSSPGGGGGGGLQQSSGAVTPNFNFQGTGGNFNTQDMGNVVENNISVSPQIVISAVEMSGVQNQNMSLAKNSSI